METLYTTYKFANTGYIPIHVFTGRVPSNPYGMYTFAPMPNQCIGQTLQPGQACSFKILTAFGASQYPGVSFRMETNIGNISIALQGIPCVGSNCYEPR